VTDVLHRLDGVVGFIDSCDALLCSPTTYSSSGRQTAVDTPCQPCDSLVRSNTYGHTTCRDVDSERGVLELIYAHCGGLHWKRPELWYGNDPICSWEGIMCAGEKEDDRGVVAINLESNNLRGSLPSQVWSLPNLEALLLNLNPDLTVSLQEAPDSNVVEKLFLSRVQLENITGLVNFDKLKVLEFTDVAGTLPSEVLGLPHLEELLISHNQFIGTFPPLTSFASDHIKNIDASHNDFHGQLVLDGNFAKLTKLCKCQP